MNAIIEAAAEVQQFLKDQGWQFCIIGGLAVVRWGMPRATQDVDVSLLTEFGSEAAYAAQLLKAFRARISDAHHFAVTNRVVLVQASNGVPLDIALAGFPYEAQVIARATSFAYAPTVSLMTASAEDLVVLKAFAGRDRDWSDVEGILTRQGRKLDWDYVVRELTHLAELKDDPSLIDRLEALRRRLGTD